MPRLDASTALAVLRIATGLLVFPHGVRKLIKGPVAALGGAMREYGFPEAFAYIVVLGELAGLLMVLGLFTRLASAAVAVTMLGITLMVNSEELPMLGTGSSMDLELTLLLTTSAALCALVPATRFSLDARRRRR
jgi:putative oxidoreductase